jgi:four helix bundle protein
MWRKSMDLAKAVFVATKQLPPDERFGLVSQMRRAAYSIPTNIAEGYGRNSKPQFIQFLGIARGSLLELQTMIQLCDELELLPDTSTLKILSTECGKLKSTSLKTLAQ